MSSEWREVAQGVWEGSIGGFVLTIVLQPETPEEAWAWAVEVTAGDEMPVAAGYERDLDAARASAERAAHAAGDGAGTTGHVENGDPVG